jgi:hypothetical protein
VDGVLESVKRAGYIATKQSFGDCQLHLEWAAPVKVEGVGQGRGNSGVFLMGNYEVQVLDSFETDPAKDPNPNPNYADGQAAAVYAENPPLVNASRAPGVWQTYDIVFHQPVWEGLKMVHPGSLTVFHNGVLVQDHWEMEGLTTHCRRRALEPHATKAPLMLQDHGCTVYFRNVWLRPLPSRWANKTHSALSGDENEVMALRCKTAEKLFAKISDPSALSVDNLLALAEAITYSTKGKAGEAWKKAADGYLAVIKSKNESQLQASAGDLRKLRNALRVLNRNNVKAPGVDELLLQLETISAKLNWK